MPGSRFAEAAARRPSLVVVAGGDGTVRQAAAALARHRDPLAIVPCGTGNVLANGLRLVARRRWPAPCRRQSSMSWTSATSRGASTRDAGGVETFVVACGMGLDARIMAGDGPAPEAPLQLRGLRGIRGPGIIRPRPSRFRVDVDGEVSEVDRTGGAHRERRRAHPPGCSARAGPSTPATAAWRSSSSADGTRSGRHAAASNCCFAGRTTRRDGPPPFGWDDPVSAEPAQPIQIDGDVHGQGWLEARIVPGAVTVLVPAGAEPSPNSSCYPAAMDEVPPPISETGGPVRPLGVVVVALLGIGRIVVEVVQFLTTDPEGILGVIAGGSAIPSFEPNTPEWFLGQGASAGHDRPDRGGHVRPVAVQELGLVTLT